MLTFTIRGAPRTKKNSQRIIVLPNGRRSIRPSAEYERYETAALWQLRPPRGPIDTSVNVCCVYYMPTRRRVDLVNLLEATCDILVKGRVLADDNCGVVASHDGSRVMYDKKDPRVEITITEV